MNNRATYYLKSRSNQTIRIKDRYVRQNYKSIVRATRRKWNIISNDVFFETILKNRVQLPCIRQRVHGYCESYGRMEGLFNRNFIFDRSVFRLQKLGLFQNNIIV